MAQSHDDAGLLNCIRNHITHSRYNSSVLETFRTTRRGGVYRAHSLISHPIGNQFRKWISYEIMTKSLWFNCHDRLWSFPIKALKCDWPDLWVDLFLDSWWMPYWGDPKAVISRRSLGTISSNDLHSCRGWQWLSESDTLNYVFPENIFCLKFEEQDLIVGVIPSPHQHTGIGRFIYDIVNNLILLVYR